MLVGGALCRAEPSMTCVGRGPVAKPPVMGPAAGTWRGSQTALSEPPTGGCHELLVGDALCRAEPSCRHDAQQRGPQHMPFREDRGAGTRVDSTVVAPSPAACGWCPMPGGTLPCLWVVPYAGRDPPMLVGRALCREEPSLTCVGRGPVAKPPVMGPAANTRRGSQTPLSEPPTGGCHELLVGGAQCRAEPSHRHDA